MLTNRHQRRTVEAKHGLPHGTLREVAQTVQVRARTWRERLAIRLFPQRYLAPALERPGFALRELALDSFVQLGWLDRIRMVSSGRIVLRTRVQTDVLIRRAESRSETSVLPPAWIIGRKPADA
mgnify:CR=1 FL=1